MHHKRLSVRRKISPPETANEAFIGSPPIEFVARHSNFGLARNTRTSAFPTTRQFRKAQTLLIVHRILSHLRNPRTLRRLRAEERHTAKVSGRSAHPARGVEFRRPFRRRQAGRLPLHSPLAALIS